METKASLLELVAFDTLVEILHYVEWKDVCAVACCSKNLRQKADHDRVWIHFVSENLRRCCVVILKPNIDKNSFWKSKFFMRNSYTSIFSAVKAASNGDTIAIAKGVYMEQVIVNKSLSFIQGGTLLDAISNPNSANNEEKEQLANRTDVKLGWWAGPTIIVEKSAKLVTFTDLYLSFDGGHKDTNTNITIQTYADVVAKNCLIESSCVGVCIEYDGSFKREGCTFRTRTKIVEQPEEPWHRKINWY